MTDAYEETAAGETGAEEQRARVAGIRRLEGRDKRVGTVYGTVRAGGNYPSAGYSSSTRFRPPRKITQAKTVAQ